ncbi:s-methyl-5-thioribose-1-phosphate isomerase [Labedaea rhizosphaerae]|uniref:Methylthioribose-1-phosphate isomerase n=1 Tax=Labedaea rhizosphaerae TaxID=598644 RepID=A0A4V3CZK9_LABRH|nr:s-methyl-5-thioribose-1-phosphate isomerase [Labedaea rhizosphaerae]TDQ00141.1 methylthioribose-1-phosphate isomerase [Labedaea rhizosphaerae]
MTAPSLVEQSVLLEPDAVRILDRRVFPFQRTWVTCRTYEEVAVAIEQMVTQSLGPLHAAAAAMVLAARQSARPEFLAAAGARLIATRPTNNHIRDVITELLAGRHPDAASMEQAAAALIERHHAGWRRLGTAAAALLHDGDTILTHCWAETYLTETVAAAQRDGKRIRALCTETRPYLQGARLTAESLAEMGVPTELITDGMAGHFLSGGEVSAFLSGADRVTMDGHVVNKVGTLPIAVCAHAFGVPFYPLVSGPDPQSPTAASVPIEERDGDEVLHCLGTRTASTLVTGRYPAFDVTPPRFVSAVVTDRGVFAPYDLASYVDSSARNADAARQASSKLT